MHALFGDTTESSESPLTPIECLLVVDSGYSHTIVTPVYKGQPLQRGIRRLELGGKHLTNYLKEMVSMRQYNMVDETQIMNDVKEAVCYVSSDFGEDMERTWKAKKARGQPQPSEGIVVDYVLPDPTANRKGFVRSHDPLLNVKKRKNLLSGSGDVVAEDFLVLGNERFAVPEILFNPSDIGMRQAGIPELILQSLSVLPTGLHPAFLANVLVVGGNALLPGFMERLYVLPVSWIYMLERFINKLLGRLSFARSQRLSVLSACDDPMSKFSTAIFFSIVLYNLTMPTVLSVPHGEEQHDLLQIEKSSKQRQSPDKNISSMVLHGLGGNSPRLASFGAYLFSIRRFLETFYLIFRDSSMIPKICMYMV